MNSPRLRAELNARFHANANKLILLALLIFGACLAPIAHAATSAAPAATQPSPAVGSIASAVPAPISVARVTGRVLRRHVIAGGLLKVALHRADGGAVSASGAVHASAVLRIKRDGSRRWSTVARLKSVTSARSTLRLRLSKPGRYLVVVDTRSAGVKHTTKIGRVYSYRRSFASWYGPGLYGNRTACGQTLTTGIVGVAHKTLPCGTKITFRLRGRTVTTRVIDRGPYVGGRDYDLTAGLKQKLHFGSTGQVLSTS